MTNVVVEEISQPGGVMDRPADDDAARLIARITQGDRQALAELYGCFRLPLLGYLLHFTSDQGLAEELLQDTLVAVWKNAGSYQRAASVQAWLFGIARRRACKRLRHQELPFAGEMELATVPAPDLEPEAALLARITRDEIATAIGHLAPAQREVVLLVLVHGLAYAEVADVLHVPLGTVKSRLTLAKRALRALLDDGKESMA